MTAHQTPTRVEVTQCTPTQARIEIDERQRSFCEELAKLPSNEREQLVRDAWQFGQRAVIGAFHAAQEARLQAIGAQMVKDVETQLANRLAQAHQRWEAVLQQYFEPRNGLLSQRLDALVAGDGELAQLLSQYVEGDDSALAKALAERVGAESPLSKKLSADDSTGVVQLIRGRVEQALQQHHQQVQLALDPLAPGGPVARFLDALRAQLKSSEQDREKQLKGALRALDANDPNSLLSNLARSSKETGEALLKALNPANPDSPLTALNTTLSAQLEKQAAASQAFEKRMIDFVTRLETQRAERAKSASGGGEFQTLVSERVTRLTNNGPYEVEFVGDKPGLKGKAKVGDVVVRFNQESRFAGAALVIECKREKKCTRAAALDELKAARENRGATLGLFVCSSEWAGSDFPELARVGNCDVLVTWNPEDSRTDARLDAAVMLALCLAMRRDLGKPGDQADGMVKVVEGLEDQANLLVQMAKSSKTVCTAGDSLRKQLESATAQMNALLAIAQDTLKRIAAGAADDAESAATPIEFSAADPADAA